jgi:hypothetical protein
MKSLLFVLLFTIVVFAQSQPVPCGSPNAIAADSVPSARTSPAAAKADASAPKGARSDLTNIAAQIRSRRPAPTQSSSSCRCGAVGAGALTAPSISQEVPILTGLSGTFRFDHVMVQETGRFSSDSVADLAVGVGRANSGTDVVSPFALKSDTAPNNVLYARPHPPRLTGAYDLVLNFKSSSPLGDGTVSNFSSGSVTWEVCGYNAQ